MTGFAPDPNAPAAAGSVQPLPYEATPGEQIRAGLVPNAQSVQPAAGGPLPFTIDGGALLGGASILATGFAGLTGHLLPASWRGQIFYVLGSRVRVGRRKALHEYPFRDGVYVEDLGRRGRIFSFNGFLVGDYVNLQMRNMMALMDIGTGPGILTHPSLGLLNVEVLEFEASEEWDEGRMWRFRAEFLEPVMRGQVQPNTQANTGAAVGSAAAGADNATVGAAARTTGGATFGGYGPPGPGHA